jgi:hypothetical protein
MPARYKSVPARRVLALLSVLALAACALPPFPALPTPGFVGETALVYPLERGWFEGRSIRYYNLGGNTPLDPADPSRVRVEPVWVFATGVNPDGSPVMLPGQDSLFDTRTGDADYSDLWRAHFVTPPAGYVPNSLTSAAAIEAAGLVVAPQPMFVNCPEAPPGSSLAGDALELKRGWVRGEPVFYFDFGPTSPVPGNAYVFITGFDAAGQPRLVAGQAFVFDATTGAAGYSDFWRVHWVQVAPGYVPDSLRAARDIDPALVTATDRVMNFPHQ